MKDFKTLMIGFLLAICMFMLMGHNGFPITPIVNVNESQVGRYQVSTTCYDSENRNVEGFILETILDTKSGEIVSRNQIVLNDYKYMRID